MEFDSSNIRNRSFSTSLRGLDEDEVYSFLDDVADRWDDMENQLHRLRSKLDEIGDAADRAHEAQARAEELEEEMEAKKKRLNEKRGEVERMRAKLNSAIQRLQEALQEEQSMLSALASGERAPSENGTTSGDARGDTGATGDGAPGAQEEQSDETSSEEWIDSLFPNRLPGDGADGPSESASSPKGETAEEKMSESETQFEAIKEDVQDMDANDTNDTPVAEEDEEKPPTDKMDQIWNMVDGADRG